MRAAVVLAVIASGCGSPEPTSGQAGTAAAHGLTAAMEAAGTLRGPWRCASFDAAATAAGAAVASGVVGDRDRAWKREGTTLRATRSRLVIAAVAQARGAAMAEPLRAKLAAEHPDLVLALGGMGADQPELERSLGALTVPGAVVVALPGDTEAWPALTAAVEHLAAGGAAIVDGGSVRMIDGGVAVVGTLPGLAHAEQLGAGAGGCLHDEADVADLLGALAAAAGDRPRLLAGPRAPQGNPTAPTGSHDRVAGVHAGDPILAAALAPVGLTLAIHGLVDAAPAQGAAPPGSGAAIAAGSLDPAPRWDADGRPLAPTVTIAVVDEHGVRWRSLAAASP